LCECCGEFRPLLFHPDHRAEDDPWQHVAALVQELLPQDASSLFELTLTELSTVARSLLPKCSPAKLQSELTRACREGRLDIMNIILSDKRVDPNKNHSILLIQACRSSSPNNIEVVQILLGDQRIEAGGGGNQAIVAACQLGYTKIVRLLLGYPEVDPSVDDNRPLRDACLHGFVEILQMLLKDDRVNPSVGEGLALQNACYQGHHQIVKMLMGDKRMDPSARRNRAICIALVSKEHRIVELLMGDPRVKVTTGLILQAAYISSSVWEGLRAALGGSNHFWPSLVTDEMIRQPKLKLRWALEYWERRSVGVLLLCVKRKFIPRVAARVNDVLREVAEKWTRYWKKARIKRIYK
jgi:hypothetical protein